MAYPPGTVFAGFVLQRVLGAGGMGTVYLARHPRLPRFSALKLLPPSCPTTRISVGASSRRPNSRPG